MRDEGPVKIDWLGERNPDDSGGSNTVLVVVTTLLDADKYSAIEIAVLYRQRWQAELNLRSLKIVLQMDHLRCKTPERVRNEFYMHLLGYNLIRRLMPSRPSGRR